jgi:hypothetical protein
MDDDIIHRMTLDYTRILIADEYRNRDCREQTVRAR